MVDQFGLDDTLEMKRKGVNRFGTSHRRPEDVDLEGDESLELISSAHSRSNMEEEGEEDNNVDSNNNKAILKSFQLDSNQSLKLPIMPTQQDLMVGGGRKLKDEDSPILEKLNDVFDSSLTFLSPNGRLDLTGDTQRIVYDHEAKVLDDSDSQAVKYGQSSKGKSSSLIDDTQVIVNREEPNGKFLDDTQKIVDTQRITVIGVTTQNNIHGSQPDAFDNGNPVEDTQLIGHNGHVSKDSIEFNDHNVVEGHNVADTQVIAIGDADTQLVNGRGVAKSNDTQVINEDRYSGGDTQLIHQSIHNNDVADTQVIGPPLSESSPNKLNSKRSSTAKLSFPKLTPSDSPLKYQDDSGENPTPAKASLSVLQIPNTAEKANLLERQQLTRALVTQSLAQVQNTQEDLIDNTFHMDDLSTRHRLRTNEEIDEEDNIAKGGSTATLLVDVERRDLEGEKPVYSSSQKNEPVEEICTDEEEKSHEHGTLMEGIIPSLPKINSDSSVSADELSDVDNDDEGEEDEGVVLKKKRRLMTVPETQSQTHPQSQVHSDKAKGLTELEISREGLTQLRQEASHILPISLVVHEDSVWAEYKFKMFPGIIQEVHRDFLVILFEDGVSKVLNQDLYLLDIRIGDKVRLKKGVIPYLVTGLQRKPISNSQSSSQGEVIRCVRGYNYVYIRRISKNKIFDEKLVSIGELYMEIEDWVVHQLKFLIGKTEDENENKLEQDSSINMDRIMPTRMRKSTILGPGGGASTLNHSGGSVASVSKSVPTGLSSPGGSLSKNGSTVVNPVSSTKAKLQQIGKVILRQSSNLNSGTLQPVSPSKRLSMLNGNTLDQNGTIFEGCIFCLTNTEVDDKREEISKLIESNGGVILSQGLQELLTFENREGEGLRLGCNNYFGNFKFCAVISNNYCRSAKYLQALAMGWPVLSDLYIRDSINKQIIPGSSWHNYLLPAGQLQRLQCVKLYEIYPFRTNYELGYSLINQLGNNSQILSKYSIIIITSNKGNAKNLETCEFIFHALGAKSLTYVTDFDKIRFEACDEGLVYDNSNGGEIGNNVVGIEESVPSSKKRAKTGGRRSKRSQKAIEYRKFGVIDWEWVVQCVINGYTWEPKRIVQYSE